MKINNETVKRMQKDISQRQEAAFQHDMEQKGRDLRDLIIVICLAILLSFTIIQILSSAV